VDKPFRESLLSDGRKSYLHYGFI